MKNFIKTFLNDQSGAAAAEYALILAVVGIGVVTAASAVNTAINGSMSGSAGVITTNTPK